MSKAQIEKNELTLQEKVAAISDTSKKIRFLLAEGKTIAEIYKLFKVYGVTTKAGGEIRYQHVRNVAITPLTGK